MSYVEDLIDLACEATGHLEKAVDFKHRFYPKCGAIPGSNIMRYIFRIQLRGSQSVAEFPVKIEWHPTSGETFEDALRKNAEFGIDLTNTVKSILADYDKRIKNFKKGQDDMNYSTSNISEADVNYKASMQAIEDELKMKNETAKLEADRQIAEVEKNYREGQIIEENKMRAFKRHSYYQSLIDEGFTKEEAMTILIAEI